jgi:hypothetical protein
MLTIRHVGTMWASLKLWSSCSLTADKTRARGRQKLRMRMNMNQPCRHTRTAEGAALQVAPVMPGRSCLYQHGERRQGTMVSSSCGLHIRLQPPACGPA